MRDAGGDVLGSQAKPLQTRPPLICVPDATLDVLAHPIPLLAASQGSVYRPLLLLAVLCHCRMARKAGPCLLRPLRRFRLVLGCLCTEKFRVPSTQATGA